ncbi:MAG: hypothetical protein AAGI45_17860 [Cyanobacteria bacterium P01_H01_bin.26]
MKTYQEFITTVTTNDATIEAVVVALTLGKAFRGFGQDAIGSGRIVRRWWESHGRVYAAMAAIVLIVVYAAVVAGTAAVYRWLRDAGVPGALTGADAVCRFLLCYSEPGAVCDQSETTLESDWQNPEAAALILWAEGRWPELAA